jgi:hypothetical protein
MDTLYKGIITRLPNQTRKALRETARTIGVEKFLPERSSDRIEREFLGAIFSNDLSQVKTLTPIVPSLQTYLDIAIGYHRFEIADYLISKGAQVTPNIFFQYTDSSYKPDALQYIVQKGISPDIKDRNGDTFLLRAIKSHHYETQQKVELLVSLGANLNSQDSEGNSPLILSIVQQRQSLFDFFLQKGADVTLKNKKGESALSILIEYNRKNYKPTNFKLYSNIQKLVLQGAGGELSSSDQLYLLKKFQYMDDYKEIYALVQQIASSKNLEEILESVYEDTMSRYKRSSIQTNSEAQKLYRDLLLQLLSKGIDIETPNYSKETILDIALHEQDIPFIKELLQKGAKLENYRHGKKERGMEELLRFIQVVYKKNRGFLKEIPELEAFYTRLISGINPITKAIKNTPDRIFLYQGNSSAILEKNTPIHPSTVVPCADSLETLHQFTGQCWNDAEIIFFWFSSRLGPAIQAHLQDPEVISKFEDWIYKETVKNQIITFFPDVEKQYNSACYYLTQYLYVLRERYNLYIAQASQQYQKPKGSLQRRQSMCYSIAGEDSGIKSALLFNPVEYHKKSFKINRENLLARVGKAKNNVGIQENNITSYISNINERGFWNAVFTPIVILFIQYFLDGNVQFCNLSKSSVETSDFLEEVLKNQLYPLFFYKFFETSPVFQRKGYSPTQLVPLFRKILENPAKYHLSMTCNNVGFKGQYGHATSFITCENGKQYFYDDNYFILQELPWSLLFKDLKESDDVDFLYIPNYEPKFQGIFTVFIPPNISYPLFMRFIKEKNSDNSLFFGRVLILSKTGEIIEDKVDSRYFYSFLSKKYKLPDSASAVEIIDETNESNGYLYHRLSFSSIFLDKKDGPPPNHTKDNFQVLFDSQDSIPFNIYGSHKKIKKQPPTNPFTYSLGNTFRKGTIRGGSKSKHKKTRRLVKPKV